MNQTAYKLIGKSGRASSPFWTLLLVSLLTLALSACGSGNLNKPLAGSSEISQNADAEKPATIEQAQTSINATSAQRVRQQKGIKVAILLPISAKGNTAKIATALKQAGQLAMFDFDNPDIILTTKDTKGTPAGAKAAASEAISSGAELIIGPLFSKNVKAAAPIARKSRRPNDRPVIGSNRRRVTECIC